MCDTIHFGRLFFRPIGQVRCAEMNDTRPPPEDHQAPRRGVLLFVNGELTALWTRVGRGACERGPLTLRRVPYRDRLRVGDLEERFLWLVS